jgi:hypothetical protein
MLHRKLRQYREEKKISKILQLISFRKGKMIAKVMNPIRGLENKVCERTGNSTTITTKRD